MVIKIITQNRKGQKIKDTNMLRKLFLLGKLLTLISNVYSSKLNLGTDYSFQQGTRSTGTTVTYFDNGDYLVYEADFSGNPKGILLNYSKGNEGGKLEIMLGSGTNGQVIGEISPAKTQGGWSDFETVYVDLNNVNVEGDQTISLVAKGSSGVMNIAWFEVSDFPDRAGPHRKIDATGYSDQSGTRVSSSGIAYFDAEDFVTYTNIDFGSTGETDGIRFNYAKSNDGGSMEVRLGGRTGSLLATFSPVRTGGWDMWQDAYIGIDDLSGVYDVTFVAKGQSGVLNIKYFQPSERKQLFPQILGTAFSNQSGVKSDNRAITHFDIDDYITYSNLNFGSSGTTKTIKLSYAKGNNSNNSLVELRLGGIDGTLISSFNPKNTGGWNMYVTIEESLELVEGIHDLTFVAKNKNGAMNLEWFELSSLLIFNLDANYNVNDVNGNDTQCRYEDVKAVYTEQVFNKYYTGISTSVDAKMRSDFGVSSNAALKSKIYSLCGAAQTTIDEVSFEDFTYEQGSQFIELYYSGRASWNEETETEVSPGTIGSPVNVLKDDAYKVNEYKTIAEKSVFKMPNLAQFDPSICTAHAAQCCWPRDRQANDNNGNCATPYDANCIDKDVADNTDLCYNKLDRSPYSNDINAKGFSTYGDEGPVHCHGFAWSTEDQEITSRYKANALFFVSMYDHMYQRGYVGHIPGSPMCGCVEHMPVVSRSDCTQTNVEEYYTFSKSPNNSSFDLSVNSIKLTFQACQGADNNNNDLEAFVQQLVNDGKLTTTQQNVFSQNIVGDNNCPTVIDELLKDFNFEKGYEIDENKWTFIAGEGFDGYEPILDRELFHEMVWSQEIPIVRRVCPSCTKNTHKDIYYRRLTPFPDGFDLRDTLVNNWFDTNNVLNVDFSLHSTYLDAYYETDPWQFCNFNDPGIGFPRDCGPTQRTNSQWNSHIRGGGDANHHAFLIPTDPDFVSEIERPLLATYAGTDYSLAVGTKVAIDGITVTHFDANDYFVYTSVNFGTSGTTQGFILEYAKANWEGKLEIRLGTDKTGQIIADINLGRSGTWDTFTTAYVSLKTDVQGLHDISFVGVASSGIMNLKSFELTDFAGRSAPLLQIDADQYADQKGILVNDSGISYFDAGDYVTYSNINFDSADGIRLTYAKGNSGGDVEIRLGDASGTLLHTFSPIRTGAWDMWIDGYIGLNGVSGIHDLTFVAKNKSGVMNIKKFELSQRNDELLQIPASEFSGQNGVVLSSNGVVISHFDGGDYISYSNINFGSAGVSNNMRLRYAKGNNLGSVEIRLGAKDGQLIATFSPTTTGAWDSYQAADIPISGVTGVHDIYFVGVQGRSGILNLRWFKLGP